MKRLLLICASLAVMSLFPKAQGFVPPTEGPAFYANSFGDYMRTNPDSALFYVRKLASLDSRYSMLLQDGLHDSFAQIFQDSKEQYATDSSEKATLKLQRKTGYEVLSRIMADSNKNLAASVRPIYFWTMAQQHRNDANALIKLTDEFVRTQLANDVYNNRAARYGLLIYQVLATKPALTKRADELLLLINNKLKAEQVNVNTDTAFGQLFLKEHGTDTCMHIQIIYWPIKRSRPKTIPKPEGI